MAEERDQAPITRNGVRLWQTVSAAAIVAAIGAIGWNFSQLNSIERIIGEIQAGAVKENTVSELRNRDTAIQEQVAALHVAIAKIDALQQANLARATKIEELMHELSQR